MHAAWCIVCGYHCSCLRIIISSQNLCSDVWWAIGLVTGCCRVEHGDDLELSKSQYKAGHVHNTGNSHLHSACSQFTIVSLSLLCMLYPLPSFRLSLKIHVIAALKLQNFFFLLFLNIITLLLYYWVSIEENKTW